MSRRTMENRKSGKTATHAMSHEDITREFVRRYYGILNSHPDQLFQFYKEDSTVIVSEFGTGISSFTETADSRESIRQLLKKVFGGITCKIKTAIPQGTVEGGVLLLVSGLLNKTQSTSQGGNEHCFTQALVLAPQKNGFYVLNDTLHIMGSLEDQKLKKRDTEEPPPGKFYPVLNGGSSMGPGTPRLGNASQPSGARRSTSSDETRREDRTDSESDTGTLKETKQRERTHKPTIQNPSRPRVHKPLMAVPPSCGCAPNQNGVPVGVVVGVPPPQRNSSPARPANNSNHVVPVPPGHGVFIARLPFGIQPDEVEKAFSAFGPILNGADGIQVRDGRNGCYAFVTFESFASAQAAIDKGAVVQGKRVYVEPRFQRPDQVEQKFPVPPTAVPPPPPAGMSIRMTQLMPPSLAPN